MTSFEAPLSQQKQLATRATRARGIWRCGRRYRASADDRIAYRHESNGRTVRARLGEHLVAASRGGAPQEQGWWFTGRRAVLQQIVT